MLKFQVNAATKQAAQNMVKKLCDDLRIYNPIASKVTFTATSG
jgi:phosphoribosylformylglycinamidine synthase